MKRTLFACITLCLLLSMLSLPVLAAETEVTWEAGMQARLDGLLSWLEAEVLPHLLSVLTILGVALVELIPAIRSLRRAKGDFTRVATDVAAYNEEKRAHDARTEELQRMCAEQMEQIRAAVATYEKSLAESEERLSALSHRIEASAARTERMVYLGLTNSGELILNGAARKISRIEEEGHEGESSDDGGKADPS